MSRSDMVTYICISMNHVSIQSERMHFHFLKLDRVPIFFRPRASMAARESSLNARHALHNTDRVFES